MTVSSLEELILRTSKEIVVKFIEVGMIAPSAFPRSFKTIYQAVDHTVKGIEDEPEPEDESGKKKK